MLILYDFQNRAIRLPDERLGHILERPEMRDQEERVAETLLSPHALIVSQHDPTVCLYHKLFDTTPVTRKYMVVAVKYLDDDAFILTAFYSTKEKKGVRVWPL